MFNFDPLLWPHPQTEVNHFDKHEYTLLVNMQINDAYSLTNSTYCYSTERILIDVKLDTQTLSLWCHRGPLLEEAFYKAAFL